MAEFKQRGEGKDDIDYDEGVLNHSDLIAKARQSGVYLKLKEEIPKYLKTSKYMKGSPNSYTYKHMFESLIGKYIHNDEFVVVMHDLGFQCKQESSNPSRYYFNCNQNKLYKKTFREKIVV
jgi:hypothetical protein